MNLEMLYHLFDILEKLYHPPGFRMFRYITFRGAAAAVTALIIAFWLGPKIIRLLKKQSDRRSGKTGGAENAPDQGGNTHDGRTDCSGFRFDSHALVGKPDQRVCGADHFCDCCVGSRGFLDDYLKVVKKKPKGLIGRYKIVGQVIVGAVVGCDHLFLSALD